MTPWCRFLEGGARGLRGLVAFVVGQRSEEACEEVRSGDKVPVKNIKTWAWGGKALCVCVASYMYREVTGISRHPVCLSAPREAPQ